jgi:sulfur carrier protein ThiS
MKINVKMTRTGETKKMILEKGSTVGDLLEKIKIKPDAIIIMSNDKPIPVDDIINKDQEILIIQVASGG